MNINDLKKGLKLVIKGELTDLNTYVKECRGNKFVAAKSKSEDTVFVMYQAMEQVSKKFEEIRTPCFISFTWYCKDRKKDPDNVCFAKKAILDGLQLASIIKQDNWSAIVGFSDSFEIDPILPRVEIIIKY